MTYLPTPDPAQGQPVPPPLADRGAAARQLAEHTRQHLTAAKSAAVATELARRALADADRIDWSGPHAPAVVAAHLGMMKRTVRQLLAVIDADGGQQ